MGARCAGSPLAALLARRGVSVALVDKATFPSDTLSSHVFEADGMALLDRLGVMDELLATGAPPVVLADARLEDFLWTGPFPLRPGDRGAAMSVRRPLLDTILSEAAQRAGAELMAGTTATGLVSEDGRIAGVRLTKDGGDRELRARLVVGADGRSSTVARLCGARRYNITPNERAGYWAFFENADYGPEPAFLLHRWANRLVFALPCDSGLYEVVVMPPLTDLPAYRNDLEAAFMEHALSCEPVARTLAGARRVGKIVGSIRWTGFFRDASGPGWVLVGDAGHFKDPAAGRGIGDAFCQAETLADAIIEGLAGSDRGLDDRLARWGRQRDADFAEHYWVAVDIGAARSTPAVVTEYLRGLEARGALERFFEVNTHRVKPSEVIRPLGILAATARLLRRRPGERRKIIAETARVIADDIRRRRLNRRPRYAPSP